MNSDLGAGLNKVGAAMRRIRISEQARQLADLNRRVTALEARGGTTGIKERCLDRLAYHTPHYCALVAGHTGNHKMRSRTDGEEDGRPYWVEWENEGRYWRPDDVLDQEAR